jgi:hypothetical protein
MKETWLPRYHPPRTVKDRASLQTPETEIKICIKKRAVLIVPQKLILSPSPGPASHPHVAPGVGQDQLSEAPPQNLGDQDMRRIRDEKAKRVSTYEL